MCTDAFSHQEINNTAKKKILVIHSFHRGQKWSDDISNSIINNVRNWRIPVELAFEYMDTKNNYDRNHLENLYRLYKYKYAKRKIDVIIATDDNALRFLIDYGFDLFEKIPVVFCGVKYFEDYLLYGHHRFTGITESVDIQKTVDIAIRLHPSRKKMLVLVDNTTTSISIIQSFIPILKKLTDRISVEFIGALGINELKRKLKGLKKDTVVLLVNFTQDKYGLTLSMQESAEFITQNCSAPIYCLWDSYLSYGVMGGCLVSAESQGARAVENALKILEGAKVSDIPVERNNPNHYIFDYHKLNEFNIRESDLPEESIIINKPVSLYHKHKSVIWLVIGSIVGLTLIVLILSFNLLARRKAEKSLRRFSKRLQFLHSVDQAILEVREIQSTAQSVLYQVRELFGCHRASVIIFDFQREEASILALDTTKGTSLKTGTKYELIDYDIESLKGGHVQVVPDLKTHPKITKVDRLLLADGFCSYFRIPMIVSGELIGTISLASTEPREYDNESIRVGKEVADTLAIAIQNAQLWKKIKNHEMELQRMSAKIMEAQEAERKRISLELHDEMGQALTAISINLSMMQRKVEQRPEQGLSRRLEETLEYVENLAEQIHDLSLDLRPPMLDDLGLVPTLRWYVTVFSRRLNAQVTFNADECLHIPPVIAIVLYRLTQEALTNIAKHASAKQVRVELRCSFRDVRLVIEDDGRGFAFAEAMALDGPQIGVGLMGMRERIDFLGGELHISTTPGSGTIISALLPLKEGVDDVQ
jgi:signal transduction histidine kinase/ABC-type uncharacterized transport system substrate-binding protein